MYMHLCVFREKENVMATALIARPIGNVKVLTLTAVSVWFLLALFASLFGVFDSEPAPPIPLGLFTVVPIAAYGVLYLASDRFRDFVLSLDLHVLTLAQTWRVGGIVFLILYWQSALPGVFALPAGWGDIAVGATAPIIAWTCLQPLRRGVLLAWTLFGLLDLISAVTFGVLASRAPIGLLAGDVSTRLMGQFPLSLIPTFIVPLLFIFHLISLSRLHKEALRK
jgi:hypothetical protein